MNDNTKEKRNTNQEQLIYQRIFDAILEQKLAPGARLTEEPLGEIFGVSRTIIRRALLRLSHEGIVDIRPNKGARVVSTPIELVDEYFTARKIVECALIKMATGKATSYQIETLKSLVTEEHKYFESGTRGKGLSASSDFHIKIANISGNTPLADFARQLISRTALIVSQYQDTAVPTCTYHDHEHLINAIENGPPEEAEKLMASHIQNIQDTLLLNKNDTEPDLFQVFNNDINTGINND